MNIFFSLGQHNGSIYFILGLWSNAFPTKSPVRKYRRAAYSPATKMSKWSESYVKVMGVKERVLIPRHNDC